MVIRHKIFHEIPLLSLIQYVFVIKIINNAIEIKNSSQYDFELETNRGHSHHLQTRHLLLIVLSSIALQGFITCSRRMQMCLEYEKSIELCWNNENSVMRTALCSTDAVLYHLKYEKCSHADGGIGRA